MSPSGLQLAVCVEPEPTLGRPESEKCQVLAVILWCRPNNHHQPRMLKHVSECIAEFHVALFLYFNAALSLRSFEKRSAHG